MKNYWNREIDNLINYMKAEWKGSRQDSKTSRHNRSIRWLCTDLPVINDWGVDERAAIMKSATPTFSRPWSDLVLKKCKIYSWDHKKIQNYLTRKGSPKRLTPFLKCSRTVMALLFEETFKNVINLEYPSIPPWITNRHLEKINDQIHINIK